MFCYIYNLITAQFKGRGIQLKNIGIMGQRVLICEYETKYKPYFWFVRDHLQG